MTLTVEPPFSPQSIGRGQSRRVAERRDAHGVKRVDLFLDGELIDTKKPNSPAHFLVETTGLEAGSAHELTAIAYDTVGNFAHDDADDQHRAATGAAGVDRHRSEHGAALASRFRSRSRRIDDGRVAQVELFVDTESRPRRRPGWSNRSSSRSRRSA